MMLRNNQLLWTLLGAGAVYWITGLFVPGRQMTALASVLLLFGGLITLWKYGPVAWRVVFHKLRNEEIPQGYGAHLAVLGVALFSAGCVWSGFATAAYYTLGAPQHWLDTPAMGFGRYMMAGGLVLAHVSPSITQQGTITRKWALLVAGVAILALGIFIGAMFLPSKASADFVNVPCATAAPIKGNHARGRKIYHVPGSDWYDVTVPEGCYTTETAALRAGYRKASPRAK